MNIRFYIDAFNLYYAAIKGKALHWLDLQAMCEAIAKHEVEQILYCTARVASTPSDPNKADRQGLYLRAIQVGSNVKVLEGTYAKRTKQVAIKGCLCSPQTLMWVRTREEKGTDVNLAARLVHDAHTDAFDRAYVMTGDTDLAEAVKIVHHEVGKHVTVVNPAANKPCDKLRDVASDYFSLFPNMVSRHQMPDTVQGDGGPIHKPERWQTSPKTDPLSQVEVGQCPGCGVRVRVMPRGASSTPAQSPG